MKKILMALGFSCLAAVASAQQSDYSLKFDASDYTVQNLTVNNHQLKVRAFEKIVYVAHPVDTAYQVMNIYIPEAYFEGKNMNGYTAETAPVFFPNQIGGYMPAKPASLKNEAFGGRPPMGAGGPPPGMPAGAAGDKLPQRPNMAARQNTVLLALEQGYVVASPGARGRTNKDANGVYTGKAPAAIVDLKAAVRYLKYNDQLIPGDANKIISNGTSAGGAMSSLLGATGDNPDYIPLLNALGAAAGSDAIFAVSAYCPITNLDHADMAYEWQFNGVNTYKQGFSRPGADQSGKDLTPQQIEISKELKTQFSAYINSLGLKDKTGKVLSLDNSGNGSFKDLVKSYVMAAAQKQIDNGKDLSALSWLTVANRKVTDLNFEAYVADMERQKTPPAFDALDLSAPENQEFGTSQIDKQHFTQFSQMHKTDDATLADEHLVKMMNPMNYIGDKDTHVAKNWRIRHGTKDKDTGLAISVLLATSLENHGYKVNLELPWDKPHSGDYDLDELFTWINSVSR